MAAIQLSGLASGFDWKTFVDQLIAAEQTPVTTLQGKQATDAKKITTLGTISGDLSALQTSLQALSGDNMFAGRSAKIADSNSTWSATAAAGTPTGQYTFNVTHLATTARISGSSNLGAPLSTSDDVTGVTLATMNIATAITAGNFTVNGKKIDIALTDSLDSVLQKMSTGTGVTASYDHQNDFIQLTSASPIVLGSSNDTSNFLTALKLFNNGTGTIESRTSLGVPNLAASIATANLKHPPQNVDADGKGTFSINGIPISFNINTDSIQTILARINSSSAGVTAAYDKAGDKFTLTNKVTGNLGITVSETSNGLLEALGLNSTGVFTSGQNAEFSINNGNSIVSTSNVFSSDVTGITGLSVTANTEGSQTISVASDNTDARSKINDFISKFNAVQDYIDAQTKTTVGSDGKVTTSTLSGNSDITDIQRSLRSMAFNSVSGLSGTVKRLQDIGIDFKPGTSDLEVKDSTALDNALSNNSDAVDTLFGDSSDGLITRLNSYITKVTGTGGLLPNMTDSLNADSKSIDQQIARLNAQLDAERTRLTNEFVAMELAQSKIQSQAAAFNNAFGSNSNSNNKS